MEHAIAAVELERAADWRIKKLGENPDDAESAAAVFLLQRLADEVRQARSSSAYIEYVAILNWLGEFDGMDDYAERAHAYRMRIGVDRFPESADAYLNALIALAKETAGI
ncbi:MAG: hypothetical protein JO001_12090 [Alphaproteobacteria bacterium]|nr:hypothetical protein [Alphaproteobacteria bacterium]